MKFSFYINLIIFLWNFLSYVKTEQNMNDLTKNSSLHNISYTNKSIVDVRGDVEIIINKKEQNYLNITNDNNTILNNQNILHSPLNNSNSKIERIEDIPNEKVNINNMNINYTEKNDIYQENSIDFLTQKNKSENIKTNVNINDIDSNTNMNVFIISKKLGKQKNTY